MSGYTLKMGSDGGLRNGSNDVDPVGANNTTIASGQERYGFNLTPQSANSTTTSPYDNANYNIVPSSATSVATSTGPIAAATGERLYVTHKAGITTATAATSYSQIVSFTMFSN